MFPTAEFMAYMHLRSYPELILWKHAGERQARFQRAREMAGRANLDRLGIALVVIGVVAPGPVALALSDLTGLPSFIIPLGVAGWTLVGIAGVRAWRARRERTQKALRRLAVCDGIIVCLQCGYVMGRAGEVRSRTCSECGADLQWPESS